MINEKVAPEILEYDAPLVASIEAQIEHQVTTSTQSQSLQSQTAHTTCAHNEGVS